MQASRRLWYPDLYCQQSNLRYTTVLSNMYRDTLAHLQLALCIAVKVKVYSV